MQRSRNGHVTSSSRRRPRNLPARPSSTPPPLRAGYDGRPHRVVERAAGRSVVATRRDRFDSIRFDPDAPSSDDPPPSFSLPPCASQAPPAWLLLPTLAHGRACFLLVSRGYTHAEAHTPCFVRLGFVQFCSLLFSSLLFSSLLLCSFGSERWSVGRWTMTPCVFCRSSSMTVPLRRAS